MVLNLRLFQKTSDLENKVDSFFLKLAEAGVIYRLAVRSYLRESLSEEYKTHFETATHIYIVMESGSHGNLYRRLKKQGKIILKIKAYISFH